MTPACHCAVPQQNLSLLRGEMRASVSEDVVLRRQLDVWDDGQTGLCLYLFPCIVGRSNQREVDQWSSRQQLGELRPVLADLMACAREVIDEDNDIIWSQLLLEKVPFVYKEFLVFLAAQVVRQAESVEHSISTPSCTS